MCSFPEGGGRGMGGMSAEFSVDQARLFRASRGQSIIYPRLDLRHLDNAAQPLSSGGGLARVQLRVAPSHVPRILNRATKASRRSAAPGSARIGFRLAYRASSLVPAHSPPCNTKTSGRDEGRGKFPSGRYRGKLPSGRGKLPSGRGKLPSDKRESALWRTGILRSCSRLCSSGESPATRATRQHDLNAWE